MKEYLTEENYQKTNKKVKLAGVIVMLCGLTLVILGIYFLIKSSNMSVPEMSSTNWYKASSAKMSMQSRGMFMLIPGIFVTIVGAMIRFAIGNRREILAYQMNQMMPLATEGMEKMAPKMAKIGTDVAKEFAPEMAKVGKSVAKEMAPVYGDVAKEITRGIKEGLKDENEQNKKSS